MKEHKVLTYEKWRHKDDWFYADIGDFGFSIIIGLDYNKYQCFAYKKVVKNEAVTCKMCVKLFYYQRCIDKHKIYNRKHKLVSCQEPFKKFIIESGKKIETWR